MKLKSIISIFCCSGFLASLLLGNFFNEDAWGYFYSVRTGCGPGGIIKSRATRLLLNNTSFPDGSSFENAIISALNEFNTDILGSGWQFSWGKDYDTWVGWEDGISEVAFMTGAQIGTNKPAYTKLWYDRDYSWSELCYYIEATSEADVLFNSDYNWTSSLTAEPGRTCAEGEGLCNVKATALHELGHAAGLLHENRWLATMGQGYYAYFGLDRNLPMIHSDDKAGMRFLYGNGTTGKDVAVHAFKQTSTVGEYGTIGDVAQSSSVTDAGFPYAFMEYTVENHGTTTETINAGFYVLQNGTWSLLGTTEIPGTPPGFVATYIRYLFIPASLPNGNYFFKVKTDYGEQISETNELNNEFQLPQLITIYMNRSAPVLDPIGSKSVKENNLLSFTVSATDADGDAFGGELTFTAANLPSGATFNAATRTFNWTPTTSQIGSYDVIFTVSDGGFSDEETIRITVTSAGIVVMPSQMISPVPGSTLSSSSVTFQWDSGIGARANYMAVGTTPPDPNSGPSSDIYWVEPMIGSSFTIPNIPLTGQPIYVRLYSNLYDGVKVFSGWNDYVYQTQVPDQAPVLNSIGNKTVNENQPLSFSVSATDPEGGVLTYSISGLPSGASFSGQMFSWTPTNSQAGNYNVTFTVSDGSLTDSETITITVVDVAIAGSDLMMTSVGTSASSVIQGDNVTFIGTVKNQGDMDAQTDFCVYFYLSTDMTIDSKTDKRVAWDCYLKLAAGASHDTSKVMPIPFDLPAGTYYVGAIADSLDAVVEGNETNNIITGNAISLAVGADLVMAAPLQGPSVVFAGDVNIPITTTVVNSGTVATSCRVNYYLSPDPSITAGDIAMMGYTYCGNLAPGGSWTSVSVVDTPGNVSAGTYYLGAIVDSTNAIQETNEANNAITGNLIKVLHPRNGGFENGKSYWKFPSNGSIDSAISHSGTKSAKLAGTGQIITDSLYRIVVTAGKSYNISGWIKTGVVANTLASYGAGMQVIWYSSAGTMISGVVIVHGLKGTMDWTSYGKTVTAPVGAVAASIRIGIAGNGTTGTAWFDDIIVDGI